MIKTCIFDLGGVVMTNGTAIFVNMLCDKYGLEYDNIHEEISESGEKAGTLYREGKITRNEFYQTLINKFSLKETIDQLEDEWINCYELNKKIASLIKILSNKYKIYYLSNSVRERIIKLNQKFGLTSFFQGGVFSHEMGVRKPNLKIYQILIDKYQINPHETVYIDDKERNLIPARELGMKAILFIGAEDFKKKLHELSIDF